MKNTIYAGSAEVRNRGGILPRTFGALAVLSGMAVGAYAQGTFNPGMPVSFQPPRHSLDGGTRPNSTAYDSAARILNRDLPFVPQPNFSSGDYNFKYGNLTGAIFGGLETRFTDNVLLAPSNADSDLILVPSIGLGLTWDISKFNQLRFDIGLGYAFYINNSELNYLSASLSPNSVIDYRFALGDVEISLYDRFIAPNDARSQPALSGGNSAVVNYQRIANTIGLTTTWAITRDLALLGGYGYTIDRSLTSGLFTALDRDTHAFNTSIHQQVGPALSVGMYANASMTDFTRNLQNDATSWGAGPLFTFTPNSLWEISGSVGIRSTTFDNNAASSGNTDTAEFSGLNFEAGVRHNFAKGASHQLSGFRSTDLGIGANYSENTGATYAVTWPMFRNVTMNAGASYIHYEQSSPVLIFNQFLVPFAQTGDTYRLFIGGSFPVIRKLTGNIGYGYNGKTANLREAEYSENTITASFFYRL